MTFSNQPVRYEIRQTGVGSGLLRQICSTVMVEGGSENVGKSFAVDDSSITAQNGIFTPLLAVRVNPFTPNISVVIKQIDVLNASNPGQSIQYGLFYNPLITGGSLSFSPIVNTVMLSAAGNGSLSVTEGVSGYKLITGYAGAGSGIQSTLQAASDLAGDLARLGTGIRGDPDTIVLAARGLGNTASNIYGSMNLLEKA